MIALMVQFHFEQAQPFSEQGKIPPVLQTTTFRQMANPNSELIWVVFLHRK
jgi:hypothetical protein